MRANVFTDASLGRYAGQFAWLAIDTEKAKNAAALGKVTVEALPSIFVVDPRTEKVLIRWVGSATVTQLGKLLDDARARYAGGTSGRAEELLARADQAFGEARNADAIPLYEQALAAAPPKWSRYARAVESLLYAYQVTDAAESAVKLARSAWPRLRKSASAANVAASGLSAATVLPEGSPLRAESIALFAAECRRILGNPPKGLPGDDQSGVHQALIAERRAAKDEAGTRRAREAWSGFLEKAAAEAKTKEARAVFDSHRLSAYIQLGTPEKAVPFLKQAAEDFPDDSNPWARLAGAYEEMKSWNEALSASDRALERVEGPRRLTVLETRIRICDGKGDRSCRRAAIEEAVRTAKSLPDGPRRAERIAAWEKRLAAEGAEPARP